MSYFVERGRTLDSRRHNPVTFWINETDHGRPTDHPRSAVRQFTNDRRRLLTFNHEEDDWLSPKYFQTSSVNSSPRTRSVRDILGIVERTRRPYNSLCILPQTTLCLRNTRLAGLNRPPTNDVINR